MGKLVIIILLVGYGIAATVANYQQGQYIQKQTVLLQKWLKFGEDVEDVLEDCTERTGIVRVGR